MAAHRRSGYRPLSNSHMLPLNISRSSYQLEDGIDDDRHGSTSSAFPVWADPESLLQWLFVGDDLQLVDPWNWKYVHDVSDGRHGHVVCRPWRDHPDACIACSRQVAVNCTTTDVLQAYLSERLQRKWNHQHVTNVSFQAQPQKQPGVYMQELTLKSQRIVSGQTTGPMQYAQRLTIYEISTNDTATTTAQTFAHHDAHQHKTKKGPVFLSRRKSRIAKQELQQQQQPHYNVLVELIPPAKNTTSMNNHKYHHCPFRQLTVLVNVRPVEARTTTTILPKAAATTHEHNNNNNNPSSNKNTGDVQITACGILHVNRQIVPNVLWWDARGMAGRLAGQGTLWLAAEFAERQRLTKGEDEVTNGNDDDKQQRQTN